MHFSTSKKPLNCQLPRKEEAIEALYTLIWKKPKKDRPTWIMDQLIPKY